MEISQEVQAQLDRIGGWEVTEQDHVAILASNDKTGEDLHIYPNGSWRYCWDDGEIYAHGHSHRGLLNHITGLADSVELNSGK